MQVRTRCDNGLVMVSERRLSLDERMLREQALASGDVMSVISPAGGDHSAESSAQDIPMEHATGAGPAHHSGYRHRFDFQSPRELAKDASGANDTSDGPHKFDPRHRRGQRRQRRSSKTAQLQQAELLYNDFQAAHNGTDSQARPRFGRQERDLQAQKPRRHRSHAVSISEARKLASQEAAASDSQDLPDTPASNAGAGAGILQGFMKWMDEDGNTHYEPLTPQDDTRAASSSPGEDSSEDDEDSDGSYDDAAFGEQPRVSIYAFGVQNNVIQQAAEAVHSHGSVQLVSSSKVCHADALSSSSMHSPYKHQGSCWLCSLMPGGAAAAG